jgi:hypothetical protein
MKIYLKANINKILCIMIIPNIRFEVEYMVYSKKIENNDILINFIDISYKEIIKNLLVKIVVNQPIVSQIIKVKCLIGNSTKKLNFHLLIF